MRCRDSPEGESESERNNSTAGGDSSQSERSTTGWSWTVRGLYSVVGRVVRSEVSVMQSVGGVIAHNSSRCCVLVPSVVLPCRASLSAPASVAG